MHVRVGGGRRVTNRINMQWRAIYTEKDNLQVVERRSRKRKSVLYAMGMKMRALEPPNVPQFCRVEYSATPTPVNSFNARKTLGRLKPARVHARNTHAVPRPRFIRDNNPRARAYACTHTYHDHEYLHRIRGGM